ncbi:MAG: D-alanyl-D-alanine carboxypeptidase, partial [Candidatus Omnitrophica bacterium]|nr:D-alanyl-D-alanine carboxypeptidase [Candidatus Omnitrophota bacterium]
MIKIITSSIYRSHTKNRILFLPKILSFICIAILLLHLTNFQSAAATNSDPAFPGVSAQAAVVLDTTTGRILFEKNADRQMRIASTTKIMTAVVALEHTDLKNTVKIIRKYFAEGSSMYLKEGEEISVSDLLYGLLLMSG